MKKKNKKTHNIAFFGTPQFSIWVLEEMKKLGFLPSLIITAPDKPKGRNLIITPPETKVWAEENYVSILQPEKLDEEVKKIIQEEKFDIAVVAAYGKIIPKEILGLFPHGVLNVHPSLLPLYRGPSPIESALLNGEKITGVSIILLDEEMDHGPIFTQQEIPISEDVRIMELEEILARTGGIMIAQAIPRVTEEEIKATPQDHARATYTKKIEKKDGELLSQESDLEKWRKFRAFHPWPGLFYFVEHGKKKIRVIIKDATMKDGVFTILRVSPEGRKEMLYEDFLKGLK